MGAQAVFEAALSAWDAGLCPIPAAEDGSKRPDGRWKDYQRERPTKRETAETFAVDRAGLGLVCGAVSGGLEMFELEARARDLWGPFKERCQDAGWGDALDRVRAGYVEETPSGGIHLLWRCSQVEGNLKLARRLGPGGEIEVLFETRGEGGFVVVAPSEGPVHPSGKPWVRRRGGFATIATITPEERRGLLAVARSFDALPVIPPPLPMPAAESFWSPRQEGWMDQVVAEFNAATTWSDVLGPHGWAFHHQRDGVSYWSRPGKDPREGHSATVNAKGTDRLIVFSSAVTGFEVYDGVGSATSYDRFGAHAVLNHGGDRVAAARLLRRPAPTPAALPEVAPQPDVYLSRLHGGGALILDEMESMDAPIHGKGDEVLHASGEATFVVAGTGVGKSTYGQNYVLRRIGLLLTDFLGLPVEPLPPGERLLYVAADRPRQILRSLRRMVSPSDVTLLDGRLLIWRGPLPYLLNKEPQALLTHVRQMEAHLGCVIREVILDSLKDVALELSKDEGGSAVAHAVNHLIGDGRELMVLHHERKPPQAAKKAPAEISDVYGSQLLTACAGNVVYLHGPPGAHVSTLIHLKQSGEVVGPLEIDHNHATGNLTLSGERRDVLDLLRGAPKGVTVRTICFLMNGDQDPDKNTQARVYRKLERLVERGLASRERSSEGFDRAALYFPADPLGVS